MIEELRAKDGNKTIKKDGLFLLSGYHPRRDVERAVPEDCSASFFIIFGEACGYWTEILKNKNVSEQYVMIHEPEVSLRKQDDLFHLQNIGDVFESLLLKQLKPVVLSLPSYQKAYPDQWKIFNDRIRTILKQALENIKVSTYFSRVWFINAMRNLCATGRKRFYLPKGLPLVHTPVLICAAGPSLMTHLDDIRRVSSHSLLISVLSAYSVLAEAGIEPDAVVVSDAGVGNKLHAESLPAYIPVFASIYASSALISGLENPIVFFDYEREIESPCWQLNSASVILNAAKVAAGLSRGQRLFVGLDLAYSSQGTHGLFYALTMRALEKSNRLSNILTNWMRREDLIWKNSVWTHSQFEMLVDLVNEQQAGDWYFRGGLELKALREVKTFPEVFLNATKTQIDLSCPEIQSESFCRNLGERIENDEILRKIAVRDSLGGLNILQIRKYFTKKYERLLSL